MGRKPKQISLFENLTEEASDYARIALIAKRRKKQSDWRGMVAVPPGSLLETIIREFEAKTNIALEIPLNTFLHYVSGALITKGSKIIFQGNAIEADVWSIVLAPSGGGKTWTQKQIGNGLNGIVPVMETGAASAAAWLEEFAAQPRALWVRDEFFQLLKGIDQPGPLADLKGYLLQIYDNSKIERTTKRSQITVEDPALTILGFTALQPFVEGISPESLLDGFAQRFGFILAQPDKRRNWRDYPVWSVESADWSERFRAMIDGLQPEYRTSPDAERAFFRSFKHLSGGLRLDESFFRRVMWRAHKYALVYHIIRNASSDTLLTEEDYGWAARLIEMQLADAAEVLEMCAKSDISRAIDAADEIVRRLQTEGQPVTARAIVSRTRLITTSAMARFILGVLGVQENVRRPRLAA